MKLELPDDSGDSGRLPALPPGRGRSLAHACLVLAAWASSWAAAVPAGAQEELASAEAGAEFKAAELEGPDEKVAELAAHRLLLLVSSKDPQLERARARHLGYLLEKLNPALLARPATASAPDAVAAQRIADALATWTTSSGPPFPGAGDVLLPLLGAGPPRLRGAVVRALKAILLHELKGATRREAARGPASEARSPTLAMIASRLAGPSPPAESFVEDAARVLWESDGKALLAALVEALKAHSGAPPGSGGLAAASASLEELRSRVTLDFASLEGWQKWWGEVKDLPLEGILADCQRRAREANVANWRQLLRRLRETEDLERVLLALQDTLDGVHALESRVAAAGALGDFAEWAREVRVGAAAPGEKGVEGDARDRLLSRGVLLLLSLFEKRTFPPERPEVLRAAIASLRKYHGFLERNPALLERVSAIVLERIESPPLRGPEDLLETLNLAGALRVTDTLGFVLSLLEGDVVGEGPGIELTTAAINALGRLLEKGVSEEASRLLMAQFRRERSGPEKAVRELRRACVTALGGGSESAEVRDRLRAFHEEILASMEKDLRIPAILGLGTLARQRDAGALDALMKVIVLHERFESQEVAAAADSIAYVGGQAALSAFADCLLETKDKGLEEHIWKKIVSAIETGKGPVFAWTLESLEERALREDSSQPLEHAVRLESEPPLVALLAPERLDLGNGDRLEPLWRAHLALARSKDALGDEAGAAAALARLAELLQKAPEAKEKASGAGRALATLKGALAQRAALRARLAKPEAGDPAPLEKDLDAVLASDPSLTGRWRNLRWLARQMAQGLPAQSAGRVRSLVQKSLGGDERRALWDGFPAGFRERYLGRLEAAGAERKAPEGQG